MTVPGRKVDDPTGISIRRVTPDYHRVAAHPARGRTAVRSHGSHRRHQTSSSSTSSAAKKYFPGENAVGQTVKVNDTRPDGRRRRRRRVSGSLETAPITEVYVPMAQHRVLSGELVIRTSGNPYDVAAGGEVGGARRRSPTSRFATCGRWKRYTNDEWRSGG